MEITLVRHAQSIWNAEDRWQGQTDVPLSEHGKREASLVGERFLGQSFDRVISSDLGRAVETARAIVGEREVLLAPQLREMNLGRWCGLPHAEVAEKYPDELHALAHGEPVRIGETGETLPEFSARVLSELEAIKASAGRSARVLVVTHGGVIRVLMYALLELSGRDRPLIGAGNTGVTELLVEADGRTLVRVYNDQRHLDLFAEEGDQVIEGPEGRRELLAALALREHAPLVELGPVDQVVLHRTKKGSTQLRRYGVLATPRG